MTTTTMIDLTTIDESVYIQYVNIYFCIPAHIVKLPLHVLRARGNVRSIATNTVITMVNQEREINLDEARLYVIDSMNNVKVHGARRHVTDASCARHVHQRLPA